MADNRRGSMAGGSGYVSRMAYAVRANPMRPTGSPAMEPRPLLRLMPDLSWLRPPSVRLVRDEKNKKPSRDMANENSTAARQLKKQIKEVGKP